MARVANAKQVVHVSDLTLDEAYKQRDPGAIAGARSLVAVPMLKDDGSNNPDPPFDAGHPDCAPDAAKETVFPRYERARSAFRDRIASLSIASANYRNVITSPFRSAAPDRAAADDLLCPRYQ